jgi:hypothetical protein
MGWRPVALRTIDFGITSHHPLIAAEDIIDGAIDIGRLTFATSSRELAAFALSSAPYARRRAGVVNT